MDHEVLFCDVVDIQPPPALYDETIKKETNIYAQLSNPCFSNGHDSAWHAVQDEHEEDTGVEVKVQSSREKMFKRLQQRVVELLDHRFTVFFVFFMTIWALFVEDIQIATPLDKRVDVPFAWITLIFLVLFFVEQIMRSVVQYSEYCFSFFWYMELLANASMVLSLGAITKSNPNECFQSFDIGASFAAGGGLAAGSRLARVMRLLRVIRVIRVFSSYQKQKNPQGNMQKNQQSMIGKRINEILVRSMILIVIALQTIFPLLTFDEVDQGRDLTFTMLEKGAKVASSARFVEMLEDYKFQGENYIDVVDNQKAYLPLTSNRLIKSVIQGVHRGYDAPTHVIESIDWNRCLNNFDASTSSFNGCPNLDKTLRCTAVRVNPAGTLPGDSNQAFWDQTPLRQRSACLSIALTMILTVVILIMYVLLSLDVTHMVVLPIESMVNLVRRLAENPTLQLEEQSKSKYETESVRIALQKIVGLMQLGFGGAGHEIISYNLANSESTGLNLMLRGKKKECAYGFCDIRQFTDTVECLQDQVMLFTNSVGEIVHQSCHDNRGEPNKNIGDAFLIVWRSKDLGDRTKIVDGALTAFRRCVREVASSQTLQLVTDVEAVHKAFGRGKYRTRIGYGLHWGFSVEGPVGSPTKIDCSYLSREVKISDRLEAATKIYSANILMSGEFYDLLSDHIKVGIRLVDNVTLKNGTRPYRIYSDDRSNLSMKMSPILVDTHGAETAYEHFSKSFHEGIDSFIKGDWPTAQRKLEAALEYCPKDTPTLLLMKEMKKHSVDPHTVTAPADWKGWHDSEV